MDEYLVPNSSFKRLWEEYKKYGSLVVAFDFDNTVYDFHKKGASYNDVISLLLELKEHDFYLICFTANEDINFVKSFLSENKIPFDSINENPPFFKGKSGKVYYNAFLDDRAGLIQVYQELSLLLNLIKSYEH